MCQSESPSWQWRVEARGAAAPQSGLGGNTHCQHQYKTVCPRPHSLSHTTDRPHIRLFTGGIENIHQIMRTVIVPLHSVLT